MWLRLADVNPETQGHFPTRQGLARPLHLFPGPVTIPLRSPTQPGQKLSRLSSYPGDRLFFCLGVLFFCCVLVSEIFRFFFGGVPWGARTRARLSKIMALEIL